VEVDLADLNVRFMTNPSFQEAEEVEEALIYYVRHKNVTYLPFQEVAAEEEADLFEL
jgi:hypothetical protein